MKEILTLYFKFNGFSDNFVFKIKNNNTNKQLIESRIISLNNSICRMTNL